MGFHISKHFFKMDYGEQRVDIDGFIFEYDVENAMYECRGEVCYDDEHDEIPEENLWVAAQKFVFRLKGDGFRNAEADYSEKGWVEVHLGI
jgi:hypothetical protein